MAGSYEAHGMKTMRVGAERIREHEGVTTVVFGSRRITIAEAVELLRIDREHGETVFGECLDNGAAGHLDPDAEGGRCSPNAIAQPTDQLSRLAPLCWVQRCSPTTWPSRSMRQPDAPRSGQARVRNLHISHRLALFGSRPGRWPPKGPTHTPLRSFLAKCQHDYSR